MHRSSESADDLVLGLSSPNNYSLSIVWQYINKQPTACDAQLARTKIVRRKLSRGNCRGKCFFERGQLSGGKVQGMSGRL